MNYRDYLPSTQFVLLFGAIAISVGLIGLASLQQRGGGGALAVVPSAGAQISGSEDSDGDGLADWEELAYGSSPTTADTDGDGTWDGQEVIEGRDPAVPGPDDQRSSLPTPEEIFALGKRASEGTDNLTEALSRELFTTLVAAKETGYSESPVVQQEIVAQALANAEIEVQAKTYALPDLAVTGSSDTNALLLYATRVGEAVIAHQSVGFQFTTLAFGEALETGDPKYLDLLLRYRDTYRSLADVLLGIPVPSSLAAFHLSLVNNTEKIVATFEDMKAVFSDPVRGFAGYKNYQQALTENGATLIALAKAFRSGGILFKNSGGESFWLEIPGS